MQDTEILQTGWLVCIQAAADILAPIAAIIASVVVIYGIHAWRVEFIGKRRIELAEDTLTLFYEARDAIQYIRSMFGHSGEGTTREPGPDETPDEKRIRDQAFVTFERYNTMREVFSKIEVLQYRFMARFGKENSKPFGKILKIIREILHASQFVGEFNIEVHQGRAHVQSTEEIEAMQKIRRVIRWDQREEDPTYVKVNETIEEIEGVCKQIINKPLSIPTTDTTPTG